MPPKKRRGGAGARGRRGRSVKKAISQAETTPVESPLASPVLDSIETSSSNSPILEETQIEAKVKLETKIHKKFGIKYHVPDEMATLKCQSPAQTALGDDIPSTSSTPEVVSLPIGVEESETVIDEFHCETRMDVGSDSINYLEMESEISAQLNQLEVSEVPLAHEIEQTVVQDIHELQEVDLNSAIVVECVGNVVIGADEEVILETVGADLVPINEDSVGSSEEVYYVMEESNEAIDLSQLSSQSDETQIKTELETEESAFEMEELATVVQDEDKMDVFEDAKEEQTHVPMIVKEELQVKEEKNEKTKSPEKPSRKSKRIFLKENKINDYETFPLADDAITPVNDALEVEKNKTSQETEETMIATGPAMFEDELQELRAAMALEELSLKEETPTDQSVADSEEILKDESLESYESDASSTKKQQKGTKKPSKTKKAPKEPKEKDKSKEDKSKKSKKSQPQSKRKSSKTQSPQPKQELEEDANVRRSSRIKTISTQKVRSRGKGLVKKDMDIADMKAASGQSDDKNVFIAPTSTTEVEHKPVKVKSRWRRSSELEMRDTIKEPKPTSDGAVEKKKHEVGEVEKRLKQFVHLRENVYLTERISCKEAKKMVCDCFLTQEEIDQGEYGCGDDCLNRLLMIECGNLCTVGGRCTNKRFQRLQSALVEAFCTEKKGLGIRAVVTIPSGEFILEYVGEVLDPDKFQQRADEYSKDKNQHHYFMSLRADAVIDATMKGNISRFINHSCEPNAETQKWTVNGELRIGFFSKRTIIAGEEITFDYQFQRYGKEAQKCFCEAPTCRGWLGEEPDDDDDEDEDDDDEDDDEEEEEEQENKDLNKEAGDSEQKTQGVVKKIAKKEKPPKKEKKPRELRPKRKPRKDIFEDLGIDDEIESLQSTGLKNQAQTLKLSRLMVRAKEPAQRTKLLKLLKKGEFPCRRLFLDYHGLRLIHGWMTDAQHLAKAGDFSMESLRLEILQTLAMLPIPNKTMLQDSKVLPTVEKWSVKEVQDSPADSDSNSPEVDSDGPGQLLSTDKKDDFVADLTGNEKSESVPFAVRELTRSDKQADKIEEIDSDLRKSTGMEPSFIKVIPDYTLDSIKDELLLLFDDDFVPLEIPVKPMKPAEPPQPKYDILVEIMALALKLLEEWASLKEVFRIPKKERIEQMKEHEREADRRYKALSVEQETERKRDRYRSSSFQRSFRSESERLNRMKNDRYGHTSKLSKHERRELFARQAAEDEDRRRKQMWSQQYKNYPVMSSDPRIPSPYDPTRSMQYVWNPQIGQWQNLAVPDPNDPYQNFPPYTRPPHMDVTHGMLPPNVVQPSLTPANMGAMPPMPNIPPRPVMPYQEDYDDPAKVQFMGPIPPPAQLPPKWKCAKDKYGRPYYYHIKMRKPQWEPPELPPVPVHQASEDPDEESESSSSSETSSLTSSSSSEDSDSDDDTRLMLEIRHKFNKIEAQKKLALAKKEEEKHIPLITMPNEDTPGLTDSFISTEDMNISDLSGDVVMDNSINEDSHSPSEGTTAEPALKKRRIGLVQELIISPRTEEDRLQFREDVKKYRQNKEIVRKQKEIVLLQTKKQKASTSTVTATTEKTKEKPAKKRISTKVKIREMEANSNSEESKRIKEAFRSSMATVMVGILNPYRKSDCKEARITTTEEFKHLARKLTHFVMLKELKHCDRIEDLECTESVKVKAREFVRKYMAKFGEVYQRPSDDLDNF